MKTRAAIICFGNRVRLWIVLGLVQAGVLACFLGGVADDTFAQEGYLYTINRDGSNMQLLSNAPKTGWSGSPNWSHNGNWVVFDSTPKFGKWNLCRIFVTAVDGPFRGEMKDLGSGNIPTWSPDDKKIAFRCLGGNPAGAKSGLWVMNCDGSDRKFLGEGHRPRWSPDGRKIACHGLLIIDLKTGDRTRLLQGKYRSVQGATWSPDSKRLTFVGHKGDTHELCVADADGSKDSLYVLVRGELGYQIPSWSPDGKQIAYRAKDEGQDRLFLINAPEKPVPLDPQKCGKWNGDPEWSPDGKKIIFTSEWKSP